MRKNIITGVSLVALSAGMAQAGGFELQTLDTSIMYADGNQAAITHATIDASIEGFNTALPSSTKKAVVKDQTVTNLAAKFDMGESLSFGLSTYRSGSIQLDGGNGAAPGFNLAPTGDIDLDSSALLARYSLNENLSFLGGVTSNSLGAGVVTTMGGEYTVSGKTSMGYVAGIAYSIPDIALRAELTYQPRTKISTTTAFVPTAGAVQSAMGTAALDAAATPPVSNPLSGKSLAYVTAAMTSADSATTLALPEAVAFNFQTGIAKDTLLTASYRKASWGDAQINIAAPVAIDTEFSDSEAFSVGIARRFNENWSASITYAKEEGSSSPATSLFTVSNGSEAVSLGMRYTSGNMTISGGISQRNVGDVTVDPGFAADPRSPTPHPLAGMKMQYSGNSVTSIGLKIAFAF